MIIILFPHLFFLQAMAAKKGAAAGGGDGDLGAVDKVLLQAEQGTRVQRNSSFFFFFFFFPPPLSSFSLPLLSYLVSNPFSFFFFFFFFFFFQSVLLVLDLGCLAWVLLEEWEWAGFDPALLRANLKKNLRKATKDSEKFSFVSFVFVLGWGGGVGWDFGINGFVKLFFFFDFFFFDLRFVLFYLFYVFLNYRKKRRKKGEEKLFNIKFRATGTEGRNADLKAVRAYGMKDKVYLGRNGV